MPHGRARLFSLTAARPARGVGTRRVEIGRTARNPPGAKNWRPHAIDDIIAFDQSGENGMSIPARLRIAVGRLLLWFTEAAMNERIARHRGERYTPPYRPEGLIGWRTWAK